MKRKYTGTLVSILFYALAPLLAFAQAPTVTGVVLDAQGIPLPGVNVIVDGTTTGTQTDFDGKYSIRAEQGRVLVFSYLGLQTQRVKVSSKTINVSMEEDATSLEEVVMVGYGSAKKEAVTGTVAKVEAKKIETKNVTNVLSALAGEVAGVRVFNTTGAPGSAPTIRIRGFGSLNASQSPLYVLDGVPFTGNVSSINPGDIDSYTVLSDASATAIYGARGANGVVVITTKSGRGESFIEAEARYGQNANYLPIYSTIKSPEEYIALTWEGLYNRGSIQNAGRSNPDPNFDPVQYANDNLFDDTVGIAPKYNMWNVTSGADLIDPVTRQVRSEVTRKYTPENWRNYAIKSNPRIQADVRMGGGGKYTRFFTSLGFLDDQGYLFNTYYKRYTGRLNVTHKKDWLESRVNMGITLSDASNGGQQTNSTSILLGAASIPPIYPLFERNADGTIKQDVYGGNLYDYGEGRGFQPLSNGIGDVVYSRVERRDIDFNANADLNITFTKGLTLENKLGLQINNVESGSLNSPFYGGSASQGGAVSKNIYGQVTYNLLNLLRYKKLFGKHNMEALVAHEFNNERQKNLAASKYRLAVPFIAELDNAVVTNPSSSYTAEGSLESYFAQVNYDYAGKYFVTGTLRRDGSSRFLNNKWGNFWSAGASWIISNEAFTKKIKHILTSAKLKASYGLIGNQGLIDADGYDVFYPGYDLYNISNLNDQVSLSFRTKGNPDLTWEVSKMFQVGAEFSIKNRLDVELAYYRKDTDNLIYSRQVGISSGINNIQVNDGSLLNRGFEFNVTGHVLKGEDYFLDLSLNGQAFVASTMRQLPIDPGTGAPKVIDISGSYARAAGRSIYDFYIREWAGVDPQTGRAQWYMSYDDKNDDGIVQADERIRSLYEYEQQNPDANVKSVKTSTYGDATLKYVGKNAIPDLNGAFNIDGGWKGIDVRIQFIYGIGGYSYDYAYATFMDNPTSGANNWSEDIRRRWQNPGDITDVPRLSSGLDANVNAVSTRFLTPASYIQLNNVKIGYKLPERISKKLKAKSIDVWASGDNLYALSYRTGYIPFTSVTGSTNIYTYSPTSTFSLALKFRF